MNGHIKVTWRTLRTIAHLLMVHVIFLAAYIHFALMFMTDNIFPVPTIKDLINEDGEPTTPFKLVTGTKSLVSHSCLFFFMCCTEHYYKFWGKGFKYASPIIKGFLRYLCWNSTASKRLSCSHTTHKEDNIFI